MNWFDRVIGLISPKAACTRVAWRQQLDLLRGFGYDAADNGRSNMNWRAVNEAADLTDRSARDVVRARARDLERNSDIFNGVVSSFKRNIIGTGFTLQVRTGNDELDSQIEKLWKRWTKSRTATLPSSRASMTFFGWPLSEKGGWRHHFQKVLHKRRRLTVQAAGLGS